tara:strand:+ start:7787 stop:9205 length:1419 start_codon:yes stop_codon:yes gene_type:complete
MAITSADPDNNPATPRPAISFGNAFNVASDADGNQSLRAEFPDDTGSSSLSEYYRGSGVVPSSTTVGSEVASTYGLNQLVETEYSLSNRILGGGAADEIVNDAPEYLWYVRKVTAAGAASTIGTSRGWQEGDLLFAWQYETQSQFDFFGHTFKIANGIVGKEYEHTDGFTYTTGPDASGVPWLIEITGEPDPINYNQEPTFRFELRDLSSYYNTLFERYYIKRRTTANVSNQQTVPANVLVPESGTISFSQLYGAKRFFDDSANIPGHSVTGSASNRYIWDGTLYPGTITTDGTDVRSGFLSGSNFSGGTRNGTPTLNPHPTGYVNFNIPLGTIYIDPAKYTGTTKISLTSTSSTDIQFNGSVDDDGGNAYVALRSVGIKIVNVSSNNTALLYTGEVLFEVTGQNTSGDGRAFTRYLNRFNAASDITNVSNNITETGRFIVYLTFDYKQPVAYSDPDFTIEIDAVKVGWETV